MILLFNVAVVEGGAGKVLCNLVALQHLSKAMRQKVFISHKIDSLFFNGLLLYIEAIQALMFSKQLTIQHLSTVGSTGPRGSPFPFAVTKIWIGIFFRTTYKLQDTIQHLSIAGSTGPRGSPRTNELSAYNSNRKHLVIQVFSVAKSHTM